MSAHIVQFESVGDRLAREQLERDMVEEVARRWAEALRDVAELGGVTVEALRELMLRSSGDLSGGRCGLDTTS